MSVARDHKTFAIPSVFLLMAMLFSFGSMQAQREPFYTQYMYNIGSFNPAYVGSVENTDFNLLYRAQWIDTPDDPFRDQRPSGQPQARIGV